MNKHNKPRNEQELEKWVQEWGLHPIGYEEYKGQLVYMAETERELNKKWEYPFGYYQVAWFVRPAANNGRIDGGSWVEFDAMHDKDKGWSDYDRRQARIRATFENAKEWIDNNLNSKRYERH